MAPSCALGPVYVFLSPACVDPPPLPQSRRTWSWIWSRPPRQSRVVISKVLCLLLVVLGDVDLSLWARCLMPGVPEAAGKTDPARPTRISDRHRRSPQRPCCCRGCSHGGSPALQIQSVKIKNFYFGGMKTWKGRAVGKSGQGAPISP